MVYECLFLVHDYLHLWTVSELLGDMPHLKKDVIILDQNTIEDLEFVYMISEAAATVGLDYWYLSKTNINDICPIDTRVIGLTSPYREADIGRYQTFNKDFHVQDISFFNWIVDAYCTGDFYGFSVEDLKKDGKLRNWLEKEVTISNKQLHFIRLWLYYIAGKVISDKEYDAPIDLDKGNRRNLVERISKKLWNISQGKELPTMQPYNMQLKRADHLNYIDHRFINIHALDNWRGLIDQDFTSISTDQFKYFVAQYLSSFYYDPAVKVTKEQVDRMIHSKDVALLKKITQNLKPVESEESGPRDLVFVN